MPTVAAIWAVAAVAVAAIFIRSRRRRFTGRSIVLTAAAQPGTWNHWNGWEERANFGGPKKECASLSEIAPAPPHAPPVYGRRHTELDLDIDAGASGGKMPAHTMQIIGLARRFPEGGDV